MTTFSVIRLSPLSLYELRPIGLTWVGIKSAALKVQNACGDFVPVDFSLFEAAYKTLSDKLRPQVCENGFCVNGEGMNNCNQPLSIKVQNNASLALP
jgi:hypothetical protein